MPIDLRRLLPWLRGQRPDHDAVHAEADALIAAHGLQAREHAFPALHAASGDREQTGFVLAVMEEIDRRQPHDYRGDTATRMLNRNA